MTWIRQLKHAARRMPPFARLVRDRDRIQTELDGWKKWQAFPPGHFYSPIPNLEEIEHQSAAVFDRTRAEIPGIDLRWEHQIALYRELSRFYADLPFAAESAEGLRYYYENGFFTYADAILLFSLLRHVRPRRVIEVGSGFSSCVMLDTAERFLNAETNFTFIEPFADRLRSRITAIDEGRVTLIEKFVQDVDLAVFEQLQPDDILFIDSSHVVKVQSDVTYLLFEVLPRLQHGVYVHFHDVFFPFEYPADWVLGGRAWNEAYFVRAFLQFNREFEVLLWGSALAQHQTELVSQLMPLSLKDTGASLWLRRVPAKND